MSGSKESHNQNRQRGLFTFLVSGIAIFIAMILFINHRKSLTPSGVDFDKHDPEDQLLIGTEKGIDRSTKVKEMIQQNSKKSSSIEKHFLRTDVIEKNACISNSGSTMHSEVIVDNKRTFIPLIIEIDSFKNFQLCFANSDHHHHSIKISLEHISEGDCDIYSSASEEYPSQINWNWKSNNPGDDSLTLLTNADEFKKASLNAVFIAITGKQTMNECKLNIEISPITASKVDISKNKTEPTLRRQ
jgi:hypothetical protein